MQTRRGAEQYERQVRQEFSTDESFGRDPLIPSPRFADHAARWLEHYVSAANRPSVVADKMSVLRNHLLPEFGSIPVDQIRTHQIDALTARLVRAGLRPKTVNNILSVLRTSLSTAQDWGLVRLVPRIHWQRVPEPRTRALTAEESRRLVEAAGSPFWRAFFIFLLHHGARFSEAAALTWGDIDVAAVPPTVHICRGGARGQPGETKTSSHRTVPLSSGALAELQRLPRSSDLVFPQPNGGMMDLASKLRHLHRACRRAGIQPIGWHALRHTYATRLAGRGVPVQHVQRLLGHTTIKMTMRYVHVEPSALIAAGRAIEDAIPLSFGHQAVTRPQSILIPDAGSTLDFRLMQQRTDPCEVGSCWSG